MASEHNSRNSDLHIPLTEQELGTAEEFRRQQQVAVLVVMFSDIEKSTQLLETKGELEYAKIRHRHDETVKTVVERQSAGRCVKHLGDGFMALFVEPSTAVERSLELHEKLAEDCGLRIRIGLDMGQISMEKAGGITLDAFGRFVNRAARINSAAMGGQTFASYHVWDSAVGWLSPDLVNWRELGNLSLKGFSQPVPVYEFYRGTTPVQISAPAVKSVLKLGRRSSAPTPPAPTGSIRDGDPSRFPSKADTPVRQLSMNFGKYAIIEELGDGTLGVVYKAHDSLIGRLVALKTISASLVGSEDFLQHFYREAQSAATLTHPNIISVYDIGQENQTPYIAMELLDGESLEQVIYRQDPMSLSQKLDYMVQICRGLDYAHRCGVVHRDIKPANLMVTKDGTLKLVDFGIARVMAAPGEKAGLVLGTVEYMSPEQVRGEPVDARADIWSAGLVFYELLTYRKAFSADNLARVMLNIISLEPRPIRQFAPDCPPELETLVLKMLRKNVAERFQTMDEVLRELDPLQRRFKSAIPVQPIAHQLAPTPDNPYVGKTVAQKQKPMGRVLWLDSRLDNRPFAQRKMSERWELATVSSTIRALAKVIFAKYDLIVLVAETTREATHSLRFLRLARMIGRRTPCLLFWRLWASRNYFPQSKMAPVIGCTASVAELTALAEASLKA